MSWPCLLLPAVGSMIFRLVAFGGRVVKALAVGSVPRRDSAHFSVSVAAAAILFNRLNIMYSMSIVVQ